MYRCLTAWMVLFIIGVGFSSTAAAAEYSKQEVERMSGEDRQKFDQLLGEDETAAWIKATSLKSKAVAQGQLRPGHLRARKP